MHTASTLTRAMAIGLAGILPLGTIATVPLAAKDTVTTLQVPVVGTTNSGGTFSGIATVTGFMVSGQTVVATGTISGLINGTQSVVASFSAPVALPSTTGAAPTAQQAPACQILNLVIGPVNLNVLGLVISIPNPIVLNITAVPGAGNLLGNLLCDVANLLNGGGALQQIVSDLNQILSILNGL